VRFRAAASYVINAENACCFHGFGLRNGARETVKQKAVFAITSSLMLLPNHHGTEAAAIHKRFGFVMACLLPRRATYHR
jgi:hypothetical protein